MPGIKTCKFCHIYQPNKGDYCSEACKLAGAEHCDVEGCGKPVYQATPFCRRHYEQLKRHNEGLSGGRSGYRDK